MVVPDFASKRYLGLSGQIESNPILRDLPHPARRPVQGPEPSGRRAHARLPLGADLRRLPAGDRLRDAAGSDRVGLSWIVQARCPHYDARRTCHGRFSSPNRRFRPFDTPTVPRPAWRRRACRRPRRGSAGPRSGFRRCAVRREGKPRQGRLPHVGENGAPGFRGGLWRPQLVLPPTAGRQGRTARADARRGRADDRHRHGNGRQFLRLLHAHGGAYRPGRGPQAAQGPRPGGHQCPAVPQDEGHPERPEGDR